MYLEEEYYFNEKEAEKYGLKEAILLEQLKFWIYQEGVIIKNKKWLKVSISTLVKMLPFWSSDEIQEVINSLKRQKLLFVKNYSSGRYERANWYAIPGKDYYPLTKVIMRTGRQ